jgi:hypothetical protein
VRDLLAEIDIEPSRPAGSAWARVTCGLRLAAIWPSGSSGSGCRAASAAVVRVPRLACGRLLAASRLVACHLAAARAGGTLPPAQMARTQVPSWRARPRPSRVRRLTAAVRRLSQAWFRAVPR